MRLPIEYIFEDPITKSMEIAEEFAKAKAQFDDGQFELAIEMRNLGDYRASNFARLVGLSQKGRNHAQKARPDDGRTHETATHQAGV